MRLIISSVGTSILTNCLERDEQDWRPRLNAEANTPAGQLPEEVSAMVKDLARRATARLEGGNVARNRALSAELNGLYGLIDYDLTRCKRDQHYLIATDTAQGRTTAGVLEAFLRNVGLNVTSYSPPGLSTASTAAFSKGMKNLITMCEQTIPGYREAGYQVVFNLVGGFKALQGYLTTLGMFYADEIVYVFEGSNQVIRIPRLPIRMNVDLKAENVVKMAMMDAGVLYPVTDVSEFPEVWLEIEAGYAILSDWGQLVWERGKDEFLGGKEPLTFPLLEYEGEFLKDFSRLNWKERADLQKKLAHVAAILVDSGGDVFPLKGDGGFQYDNYVNKYTLDGRPVGHFRVNLELRVSCIAEKGMLRLRRYGSEPEVNANP